MKISFIATVYNEEKKIDSFFDSLFIQSKLPDEIIIVDGMSTDKTLSVISKYVIARNKATKQSITGLPRSLLVARNDGSRVKIKIIQKKGNRSVGRNEAIRHATGNIILCSDAGNILDKNWVKNIVKPFIDSRLRGNDMEGWVDVVAGYYKGKPQNVFQKCLIPYVLVMPDKIDPDNFLPATRSTAFKKTIWKKVGGFDEHFSHNEDYVFAKKLKEIGAKIVFAKDAVVNWIPRNSYKEAFIMFFRFAFGDSEAGIMRTNVLLLFARYFLSIYFIFLTLLYKSFVPIAIIFISFLLYIFWAIKKNYKYVKNTQAFMILPLLQFVADAAVLSGTICGLLKRIGQFNYLLYIKQNKFLFFIICVYLFIIFLTLRWGIPNQNHPFPYFMDEWHQLHAVATTFTNGTPNVEGSAEGTMFHFLFSGFYLIPFTLAQIIDPFAVKEISNSPARERLFEILRLQTAFFGVFSIFIMYKINQMIKGSGKISLLLFVFNPLWLLLSGYFKYDIALIFWILLSVFFFLRFAQNPTNRNFLLAAIPASLAVAVKVSALPIALIYGVSYFWFIKKQTVQYKYFFFGVCLFLFSSIIFGIPDTLFGRGNIINYLFFNLMTGPNKTSNFILSMNSQVYLLFKHYPLVFGYGFITSLYLSLVFWTVLTWKKGIKYIFEKYKSFMFILVAFIIFLLGILPAGIYGGGNRSLVLLPFLVLIISKTYSEVRKISFLRKGTILFISFAILVQFYQTFAWTYMKITKSPQQKSSEWIISNIPSGEVIGVENIPIYQFVPDIIQKEFYFKQYGIKQKYIYKYEIIDSKSTDLPEVIVLTNSEIESITLKQSVKREILNHLTTEGYKKTISFSPDFTYFKSFGNNKDYFFSGLLVASPQTISVFEKH